MATRLKDLSVEKVDFVDEGANPDAHIRLFKNRGGIEGIPKAGNKKGGVWKKLFGFIGKAADMAEEIDSAMAEIQKNDSMSFGEKIHEANNRKIYDEMWDVCFALQSSLCSILEDGELDSIATAAAMQESLEQFYIAVKESIGKWSGGKTADIVKNENDISESELQFMKSMARRLDESIKKSIGGTKQENHEGGISEINGGSNNNLKGDKEGMEIDKKKLTEAERAFLESIEKRCGLEEGAGKETGDTVSESSTAGPVQSTDQPPVAKSVQESGRGSLTDLAGDIYKGLHPAVKAELERLKKFREEAEDRELAGVAKRYAIIGKKEDELVPLFKSLKAAGGTAYQDMVAILDQAAEAVEKSGVFSEIGKSGYGSSDGAAWAEADAKAVELMKSKTGLTKAQALDAVFMENPELAERCEKEE